MIFATLLMSAREVLRHGLRSLLTALGIVIGVAAVIALVTLGRGATQQVTSDIAGMGANLLILSPGNERRGPASSTARAFKLADVKAIAREVRGVRALAPASSGGAVAVAGNVNWNTTVNGVTDEFLGVRGFALAAGHGFSDADLRAGTPVCVLGATVRQQLFGAHEAVGATVRVGALSCAVVGTLAAKGRSTFGPDPDDLVLVPLATYQRRIAGNDEIGTVYIAAEGERFINKVKGGVEALMRERRHVAPGQANDFAVQDMREMAKTLGSVTATLTALLGAVAAVSLLVGGIGIMNIMLVSVTERTREIGLRLAIGATGGEVMLQFLIEAGLLATLGGSLGVALGLSSSFGAARLLRLPFVIAPEIVVVAFAFSATLGVVFGFLPARRASRLDPIIALRRE